MSSLGHENFADALTNDGAVLFVADGAHPHDAAIWLASRLALVEDLGLGVDGVSVKRRVGVIG